MNCLIHVHCIQTRQFGAPPVDIFNTLNVSVSKSIFHSNKVTKLNDPYHGDSAGLSIAYNFIHAPSQNPHVHVSGCTFRNNVNEISPLLVQLENLFNQHLYPARGSGTSIIITENITNVTVVMKDCMFEQNNAQSVGGGLYLVLGGINTIHSVNISSCQFVNNTSNSGGGAAIGFLNNNLMDVPSIVVFTHCIFENNSAQFAGGLTTLNARNGIGNLLKIISSNFMHNTAKKEGSAIVFGSFITQQVVHFYVVTDW